ncbi:hypothetical protein E4U23_006450 [Claviceps purpurea]|nr:hypothetical protein E4U23_006450 [Claviceps purpurea]
MEHNRYKPKHYESFVRKITKDRDDGTFCDLEIDCGERRFRAHRNVVCLHSPVIRAAFFGKLKKASHKADDYIAKLTAHEQL